MSKKWLIQCWVWVSHVFKPWSLHVTWWGQEIMSKRKWGPHKNRLTLVAVVASDVGDGDILQKTVLHHRTEHACA